MEDPLSGESEWLPNDTLSALGAGGTAIRGGFIRLIGYFVGGLFSIVAAALLFRHLGVDGTGKYITALSLAAIVVTVSDLGLNAYGIRQLATMPRDASGDFTRNLLGLRLILTFVGGAAVIAMALAIYGRLLGIGVSISVAGVVLQVTQDNMVMPLYTELRFTFIAAFDLIRQLVMVLCILLLVVANAGLLPLLAIQIPANLVALSVSFFAIRHRKLLLPRFHWKQMRPVVTSIIPYAAGVAAAALYFRVSIIVVSLVSNAKQLGFFSASFRIIEVGTAVPLLIVTSAFPIVARSARVDRARWEFATSRLFHVAALIGAWVAVSIAVGAPLAIEVIGGRRYAPASSVLALQGIALGIAFINAVFAYALLSLGSFRRIVVVNVGALATNAVLVAVLGGTYGARGAAIATDIAEAGLAAAQIYSVFGNMDAVRAKMRPLARILPAIAVAIWPIAITVVPVVARLAIAEGLFALAVMLLRAYPPEALDAIPSGSIKKLLNLGHSGTRARRTE